MNSFTVVWNALESACETIARQDERIELLTQHNVDCRDLLRAKDDLIEVQQKRIARIAAAKWYWSTLPRP